MWQWPSPWFIVKGAIMIVAMKINSLGFVMDAATDISETEINQK